MSTASVIPASLICLLLCSPSLQAMDSVSNSTVKESRYVTQKIGITQAQTDVMQSVVRMTVPDQIKTVGAALQYLLKPYGYQIEDESSEPESAYFYVLLTRTLPEPHRTLNTMTLYDALDVLGGDSFEVVINPVLRTVSYRLEPALQNHVSRADLDEAQSTWKERTHIAAFTVPVEPLSTEVLGYGPVKPGDTLSNIVLQFDLSNVTLDQALVHAFRANPDAFANGNMNHLLVGEYLSVPPLAGESLTPTAASRLVDDHYSRWLQQVQP